MYIIGSWGGWAEAVRRTCLVLDRIGWRVLPLVRSSPLRAVSSWLGLLWMVLTAQRRSVRLILDVESCADGFCARAVTRCRAQSTAGIDRGVRVWHGAERPPWMAGSCRSVWHADRKSTRLNSSHVSISYAVCCLK